MDKIFCPVLSHVQTLQSHGLQSAGSSPWDFPGKNTGEGCHFSLPGGRLDPGIGSAFLASPALQVDSLPTEPSGKPFNLTDLLGMLKEKEM